MYGLLACYACQKEFIKVVEYLHDLQWYVLAWNGNFYVK